MKLTGTQLDLMDILYLHPGITVAGLVKRLGRGEDSIRNSLAILRRRGLSTTRRRRPRKGHPVFGHVLTKLAEDELDRRASMPYRPPTKRKFKTALSFHQADLLDTLERHPQSSCRFLMEELGWTKSQTGGRLHTLQGRGQALKVAPGDHNEVTLWAASPQGLQALQRYRESTGHFCRAAK